MVLSYAFMQWLVCGALYVFETLLLVVRDSGFEEDGVCSELSVEQGCVAVHLQNWQELCYSYI
jgi:hypothetical protein